MLERAEIIRQEYLRHDKKFPHVWCPGCGNGIIMGALLRAIHAMGLSKDEVVLASGIGCSGRMPTYVDFNTIHTTHGRALTFSTGIKLAKPELTVLTVMGDGDATAIGGNHFIHAARRNLDLTAIIINNSTYGMTGGQYSPTTPFGSISTTSVYGHVEHAFSIAELAVTAGASFVARGTVYHATHLEQMIKKAVEKKGFSVVEVISNCHVQHGRRNKLGGAVEMINSFKKNAVTVGKAARMQPEELEGKITIGVLADHDKPISTEQYRRVIAEARQNAEKIALEKEKTGSIVMKSDERYEIRFSGSGGQGIITAAVVLADAVGSFDAKYVCQTQSYGPEARGGKSKAEVVISKSPIDYPKALHVDLLLAMNQTACDAYFFDLKPDGLLVVDSSMVQQLPTSRSVSIPFTRIAREQIGRELVANMVALGAVGYLCHQVSLGSLAQALASRVPRGTEQMNSEALQAGIEEAKKIDLDALPRSVLSDWEDEL